MQYLYDPVTGDGPPSTTGTTGSTQFSTSSIDTSRERGKPSDQNNMALRRKKTPTQLRRERKKRQKERERRQRDLEKRNEGQFKQQTEDKDSETETKAAIRGECSKEGDNEDQKSSSPTSDSTTREGNSEQSTTTDHRSTLGDELSSSESEPHPESSRNNSQDHSPTHSTSSIEKSLDNDTTTGEEQRNHEANSHSQCSDGLGETNREEPAPTDEDVVFLEVISTGDKPRQLEDRVNNKERSPSLVVMTEEAASKVKINQESSHQATKTKTDASVLTAAYYEEKDNKPDGGMENGVAELELELKPEE